MLWGVAGWGFTTENALCWNNIIPTSQPRVGAPDPERSAQFRGQMGRADRSAPCADATQPR